MSTTTVSPAPAAHEAAAPARRGPVVGRRVAAVALVAGAALNTAQAVLTGLVLGGRDRTGEQEIAAAVAHPQAVLAVALLGLASVPPLLIGFQATAHLVRARLPRVGAAAALLTFVGVLGFLGLHGVMLAQSILVGAGHAGAVPALQESPLALVVVAPFLLGMFGGTALLAGGLAVTRGVPRWIPVAYGLFWVLDLAVGAVGPVDPHWLFLAASTGIAVAVLRAGDQRWTAGRL
ncbi:hypothetical protein [Spirilliplanes yamanashiensis]|uniref:DUF4386 family protein n=1 Tax=Spirilliplanes yamanashiensis TaxID=42233 RepID=A0A8J3Y8X2_9ACTN|nr:hypothetical protein [Spirilliplanes yamanashiensis]MDP9816960.1 hypothetical protein [Spirilliplanes yamanashiensis]GIJ03383.1 hypothetical protein Sya03_27350 [Spirilliplanes yamanashiensis]